MCGYKFVTSSIIVILEDFSTEFFLPLFSKRGDPGKFLVIGVFCCMFLVSFNHDGL